MYVLAKTRKVKYTTVNSSFIILKWGVSGSIFRGRVKAPLHYMHNELTGRTVYKVKVNVKIYLKSEIITD